MRSLSSENPALAAEWDYDKNGGLTPDSISPVNSQIKVWWKCTQGHSWQSKISNRVYGNGCPYCSGLAAIKGVNDLATVSPGLAAEWDYTMNVVITPDTITSRSSRKIWWKCVQGHSWQSSVKNRSKGNGCPYCSGLAAIKGVNDLATANSKLASEWNYNRNIGLTPDMVKSKSSRKVWWTCPHGHHWQATVWNRTKGSGCPYCSGLCAIQGVNDLATANPVLASEWDYDKNAGITPDMVKAMSSSRKFWWKCLRGHSWQAKISARTRGNGCPYCSGHIAIPGINDLATENSQLAAEWDYEKNGDLRPEHMKSCSSAKAWWLCDKGHSWQAAIYSRNAGSGCPYCTNQAILSGYNDLATVNPELAAQWDYEKNQPLLPDNVAPNSKRKVWWRCSKGHSWLAAISDRNGGSGCHVCSGKLIVSGKNDLAARFPEIALQWDYEKNGTLSPDSVAPYSNRKVWWICSKGHSCFAALRNRANGNGCPHCSGQAAVIPNYNDLATENPALAAEWDYDKNGSLRPEMVKSCSEQKIWWRGLCGHSWQTSIAHRHRGSRCPYCSGRKVLKGFNDIPTTHPHIAAEWDCDKNGTASPEGFCSGSAARAWWKCDKGHSWNAKIRTRKKHGCPYCAGNIPDAGVNDLGTLYPGLTAEWDCERNGDLLPQNFTAASGKKVWWNCQLGHSYQATIASRSIGGSGCPYCAGKTVLSGLNDLATVAPRMVLEWDSLRNGELRPDSISLFSRTKVWWKCERGHSWHVSPFSRSQGSRCPYCAGKRPPKLRLVN